MSGYPEVTDLLRDVARQVLANGHHDGDTVGLDWGAAATLGWLGIEIPEDLGGAGGTFAEVAVIAEELGRATSASPFTGTVVLSVAALAGAASCPGRDELLSSIATGKTTAAVAIPAGAEVPDDGFEITRSTSGARLTGCAHGVMDADSQVLLCLARDLDGEVLVALPRERPGLRIRPTPLLDTSRSIADVTAADVAITSDELWPVDDGLANRLRLRGALATAADSVGVAEAALAATVTYTAQRHQFGRAIGSFQAVKHQCADVFVGLAASRELLDQAVRALVSSSPDAATAVSRAKAHASELAVAAAGTAMQLHGGFGYSWESGIHLLLKRGLANRSLFGSPRSHRQQLVAALRSPSTHHDHSSPRSRADQERLR